MIVCIPEQILCLFCFRYSNIKKKRLRPEQVIHLFDTGDSSFRDEIVEMPAKRAKDGRLSSFLTNRKRCSVHIWYTFSSDPVLQH